MNVVPTCFLDGAVVLAKEGKYSGFIGMDDL